MVWSYRLEKKAEKDLQRLPKTIQQRVLDFLYLLEVKLFLVFHSQVDLSQLEVVGF